jgi:D-alanyl-D-alanine carboxypeptidase
MATRMIKAGVVGIAALLSGACNGDDEAGSSGSENADGTAELQALADRVVAEGVPGVLVLSRKGQRTITIASGVSDLATGRTLEIDDRVRVASVTKSYVATIILQLVEEQTLSLGDRIERWLPGLLPASGHVTVEQLLRHESGIYDFADDPRTFAPYFEGDYGYAYSPVQLVAMAGEHARLFEAGMKQVYSNTNFTLLGLIAEAASGMPFEALFDERIVQALGLEATHFARGNGFGGVHSHGYIPLDGQILDVTDVSPSVLYGCGNVISTQREVAIFFRALLDGELLTPESLSAMKTPGPVTVSPDYVPAEGRGFARGLGVELHAGLPCGAFVGHAGQSVGYYARSYQSEDGQHQFVVIANSSTIDDKVGSEAAVAAFDELTLAAACP